MGVRALVLGALTAAGLIVMPPSAQAAACDPPVANPIACENSLPGNPASEWDITGSGDASIQGFATEMSVNRGSTVTFKVNTDASSYRIDIYRIGYYQGNGARLIATVQPSAALPQAQPPCAFDSATELVDCGNWGSSAQWAVPASAVSGIYIGRLVRSDTGGASHVLFVVRADDSHAGILYQTSDQTWQAYNRYGGYSLYYGSPRRAYKVSYNRPFLTRDCCDETYFFSAEFPMIRWLERNGYDVAYSTGSDTDRFGSLLLNHRVFVSSGHDEYWSGQQRANVEAARSAGVNLAFFSGNEVFWKTRWEPSIDGSSTSYRTLVSYKETYASARIDPADPPTWTGTWRDPRFSPPADGGRPENGLTGQAFMVNCCDSAADQNFAITIPETYRALRFWRNTPVASLPAGGVYTLPAGTLGYEWDEDLDNGSRPAGLIHMSSTTQSVNALLQDYGNTYAPGVAVHHLTLYRAASGALVFGAGTIRWAWGLDAVHDTAPSNVDATMQQATVNLLADMGVQPSTLQSGLVGATASSDATAPTATVAAPSAGTTLLADQPTSITGSAVDLGGGVVAAVEVSTDDGATWHPVQGTSQWSYSWTPRVTGTATIRARAVDDSGNMGAASGGTSTTVIRVCPCSIWPATSAPGRASASDVNPNELGVKFRADLSGYISGIRFYKGSANTGTHTASLWTRNGTRLATATFTSETASGWQQVSFATPVAVTAGTTYVASYFAPSGRYAQDLNYFTSSGVTSTPLRALQAGVDGANAVYRYAASGFPTTGAYQSSNYWVDVVFNANPPGAPTGLSASAGSPSQVTVSWTNSSTANGYRLDRSPDGATWTTISTPGPSVTSFVDTGLIPATLYYYRLFAVNSGGTSPPSATASAITASAPPPAPSGLTTQGVSGTSISLNWTNVGLANGYSVERSADGVSGWTAVGTTTSNTAAFVDSGLQPDTTYWYRVRAMNNAGSSPPSSAVSGRTLSATPPPGSPGGLTATATSTQVQLTWSDVSGEDSYLVQRSSDGLYWVSQQSLPQSSTSYVDADEILSSTTYYYRVLAHNSGGNSTPSNTVSVTTLVNPPATPTGLTATVAPPSTVNLAWSDVGGETGFSIRRSSNGGTTWVIAGTTGQNVLTFSDVGLASGTTYLYEVSATNQGGSSPPSASVSATTPLAAPDAPTGVSATAGSHSIVVAWTDVASATGFTVQRSPDGSSWTALATTGAHITSYADTGLAARATWFYRVIATNTAGASPPSTAVFATTLPDPPPVPIGLTANALSASQVALSWQDVAGEDSYTVERSINGTSGWAAVGGTAQNVTSFSDSGLTANTAYFYRVTAVNSGGSSAPSPTASTTTHPAAPTGTTATVISSTEIRVAWSAVTGATGYRVEQSADGNSGWVTACLVGSGVLACSVSGLTPATTYYFRVVATSDAGDSAPSATTSATTSATASAAPPPSTVNANATSTSTIDVSWSDVVGESGYLVQRSLSGTTGWSTVGTTAADVLTWTSSGLDPETTYYFRVITTSAGGDSTPSVIASAATFTAPPGAPADLAATASSPGAISLTWSPVATATSYAVERSSDGSTGWQTLGTTSQGNYTDSGLAPATSYWYRVSAMNAGGSSAPSAAVSATTLPPPPPTPTGLSATALSQTQVRVSWADVPSATGFTVARSPNGSTGWSSVGSPSAGATRFDDSGLDAATTYYYRVTASNPGGSSAPSDVVAVATLPPPPGIPTGVTAQPASASTIALSWGDVAGATGFTVQRSSDGSTGWAQALTTGAGVTTAVDSGLPASTTFYYRVIATNAGGSSQPSAVASATTLPPPPGAPQDLIATVSSSTSIALSWSDSATATGFSVQRSGAPGGPWTGVGSTGQHILSFTDTALTPTTTYYYRVLATNAGGSSPPSSVVSATTFDAPPSAPTGVQASAQSQSEIRISWSGASTATSFTIARSPDGLGSWVTAGTAGQGATSYVDGSLTANTTYYYRVTASNSGGSSQASAVASATTLPPPPATPTGVSATTLSNTQVRVSWTAVAGAAGYTVERSPDGTTGWSTVGTVSVDTTSFTDSTPAANGTYYYRVLATNASGSSTPSTVVSATTPPFPPTAPAPVTATAASSSSAVVSWTDTTAGSSTNPAATFTVQRSSTGVDGWTTVGSTSQGNTTYLDTGLAANTRYYYRVIATNTGGSSPASAVVSATTDVATCPCSLWSTAAVPTRTASSDVNANELGVKFRADVSGVITGIRFYKGVGNTGTHTGSLWSRTGALLATATFSNETATGWQQVSFATPVPVTAGVTYIASYFAPVGRYAQDVGYFATKGIDNGPLHGLMAGVDGANGVYRFGASGFPTVAAYQSSNYWVDVMFTQAPPSAPTGLTVGTTTATSVPLSWSATATATGYKVDRSADGTSWSLVGSATATVTTFNDIAVLPSRTYYYRLRAINYAGSSSPSTAVTATTQAAP